MTASASPLARWALALGLGALGGGVFAWIGMPLPWMLGAMTASTVAAVSGLPVAVPAPLRNVMIGVLGLMLGSAFHPGLMQEVPRWLPSLAALAAYVAVVTALVMLYYRRAAGWGPVTSYFAAAPGGLNEMILLSAANGGDDRTVSLVHALRILLTVFTVPLWYRLFEGYAGAGTTAVGTLAGLTATDVLWLAVSGVAGFWLARALRVPAARITGPMFLAAALHLGGVTDVQPPGELVALAQVVVGSAIGCRFVGVGWGRIGSTALIAAGSAVIMLGFSVLAAVSLAPVTGVAATALLLALVPGGLAEMCLIAMALGTDVAFVSSHHVARIVMVVMAAPLAFRLTRRWFVPVQGKTTEAQRHREGTKG